VILVLEICYSFTTVHYCFSQGSVATQCRCGSKYDMDLVANLLLILTVKIFFFKSVNPSQNYE